jgi:hypothetical protein
MARWSAGKGQTRRSLLVGAVAGAASVTTVLAAAGTAAADETWCELDPPVAIRTPAGRVRVVFVTDSGPAEYRRQLMNPDIEYSVRSADRGAATEVRMTVTIRNVDDNHVPTRSEVWTGPNRSGQLLSSKEGHMGRPITHNFKLDLP